MRRERAIEIAEQGLIWLAGEPDAMGAFLAASGLAPSDLRARVEEPEFLGFVLDFLLGDEATLLAFCGATGVAPAEPARARAMLPGGDIPDWT
ncbi:MAG: DUF3572 domain-containing protein [Rhodovulum sulfidophilum]|uniref:DUF3572 domain-containing protein n=1 Tax=Rhodovulum sulfidophilum TaxID=35806 RepID=A0A2W5Q2D6_RHOSU|nr:MAG: DUF3572 domain-containing protein [Rhodovulum sulfidophilum]